MHLYAQIYEFSASVGAFEGYVYNKKSVDDVDMDALEAWTANLVEAFNLLPSNILEDIRAGLDLTLNRSISSCNVFLGKNNMILERLHSMLGKEKQCSPDDFQKEKWFQKNK